MKPTDKPSPNWRDAFAEFERLLSLDAAALAPELDALRQSRPELYPQVHTLLMASQQAQAGAFMATELGTRLGSLDDGRIASELKPGEQIGQYRLERTLGEGGMGEVWLARRADGLFETPVALKLMHLHLAQSSARERFVREGRILGELTHGNVGRLLDAGVLPGGQLYLALEYISGERIDRWCDEHKLAVRARVRLFLQVCDAVAHAHAHLVVHRDLKPSNILVTDDGIVKLLDFGIAKLVEDEQSETPESELTRVGGRALTPDYAAPEQIEGGTITVATDVYALGLILYTLLSGARPYGAASPHSQRDLERAVLEIEPRAPSAAAMTHAGDSSIAEARATTVRKLRADLRGDLDVIIGKALKKSPKERYPTALALAADLRSYLDEQPISARPDSFAYRSGKFIRRHGLHRRRTQLLAMLALAIVIASLGFVWDWQQREKQQALDSQSLRTRIALLYDNGRRELLAHNEARAAVYLNEVYKLGVDTPALRYMLGRAMRVVDAQKLRINTGSPVLAAQASPDGRYLFGIGSDHHLREYEQKTGRLVFNAVLDDTGALSGIAAEYSPSGGLIWVDLKQAQVRELRLFDATAAVPPITLLPIVTPYLTTPTPIDSLDQTIAFIDRDGSIALADRKEQQKTRIAGNFVSVSFCRDSDLVLAGLSDGSLQLLDRAGHLQRRFTGLHGATVAMSSTPGCGIVAAGSDQGSVRAWDGRNGELLMSGGHSKLIGDLQINNAGSRLTSLSRDSVAVWAPRTGALIYSAKFLSNSESLAQIRPDGQVLARLEGGRLSVLDPVSGTDLYSLDGHLGAPAIFAFDASNHQMLTSGADGALVMWELPQRQLAEFPQGPSAPDGATKNDPPVAPAVFSHDGHWLFAGGADGGGAIWDAKKLTRISTLAPTGSPLSAVAFSSTDRLVAVGDWNQTLRIIDRASGKIIRIQQNSGGRFFLLDFDATGRVIAGAISGGLAKLWDAATGAELASFQRDEARATALSPDGSVFAVGTDGVIKLWDLKRRGFIWSTSLPKEAKPQVGIIAFSPDGKRLLATSMMQDAYLLDAHDGNILQHVNIPASTYLAVGAFDSKGEQVVLGDGSKSAVIWRPFDGRVLSLSGHTAPVLAASFSRDAAFVLTSGEDGIVKIWDAGNGDLLDSFAAQAGAVQWNYARFGPDWTQILTGGTDNVARLWAVPREQRNAATIAALLRCRVAWKAGDASLEPAMLDTKNCKSP